MNLTDILDRRIDTHLIRRVSIACSGPDGNSIKENLYSFFRAADDRIAYNALWIFTHLQKDDILQLGNRRDELTDLLLATSHTGRRRLLLTFLDRLPMEKEDIRTDYLDFCLSRINSGDTYGIRVLCIKQAFAICRFYPELLKELQRELEMLDLGETTPGLLAARRNILNKINRLR